MSKTKREKKATTTAAATPERSGAKCLVEALERAGVSVVFGYPGGAIIDVFNVLTDSPIHLILPRHEQGAAHMADGYARASGKVGVCMVTSGPGATNAVTGLATAYMDGIPLVCVSGQVPTNMIGNDAFQEADITGITRSVTKHNFLVKHVDEIPQVVAEAFHIAATGKPGPVLIDLPKDIQRQTTSAPTLDPSKVAIRSYAPYARPSEQSIEALAKAITIAKRPLLYVGGGAIAANASTELTKLARKLKAPVTATLMGLGAFPEDDPLSLRMLGMHGSFAANKAVSQCDLLISIGARFDDRVTGKLSDFAPLARVAHIDIDQSAIGKNKATDYPIHGDVKEALQMLLKVVKPGDYRDWLKEVTAWKEQYPFSYKTNNRNLSPQYVIEQTGKVATDEAIIVTDVGQHQMWAAQLINYRRPRHLLTSGGLGTMGFGVPAAIGALFGCPGKRVVAIVGDGGVQMTSQEIVVAVEHQLQLKVVIVNNGTLGMVRQWQQIFYNKNYSAVILGQSDRPGNERITATKPNTYLPDFVKLAESMGAVGVRVNKAADVVPTLEEAFASPLVWVMEFRVMKEENVFPMVPAGGTVEEIIHRLA